MFRIKLTAKGHRTISAWAFRLMLAALVLTFFAFVQGEGWTAAWLVIVVGATGRTWWVHTDLNRKTVTRLNRRTGRTTTRAARR